MSRFKSLFYSAALLLLTSTVSSCTDTVAPPPIVQKPASFDSSFHYRLLIQNLHRLPANQEYVMWLQYTGDSNWSTPTPLTFFYDGFFDSLKFLGQTNFPLDSHRIARVLVSVESKTLSAQPTSPLISGDYSILDSTADLFPTSTPGIGDLSGVRGNVTFTTKSSDTTRAKLEFYLMRLVNGQPVAGLDNLPPAPTGWHYAVWVVNPSFYPAHQFYYGSFTAASGFDSQHTYDNYPFPGGYKASPLNDPGARIEVTLEPAASAEPPAAPSPILVMEVQLRKFISQNEMLTLQNVWPANSPQGQFKIYR